MSCYHNRVLDELQGFAGARSNALEEEEVVLATKSLAHLVSPEVVLQASDE
jgi:hypothetical protein